ncbi:MAG: 4a-hydroxytetrahydrobiopterin dehydratase [Sphingomonadales bacterium]|jgi:4a-hydroxytetrahydrobiopterin dehydratase
MIQNLNHGIITQALQNLEGWSINDTNNSIHKTFRFVDFKEAFSFMTKVAELAETMNHHPEWFNIYNRLEVKLTTHEAGGITKRDIKMARAMNEFEEV